MQWQQWELLTRLPAFGESALAPPEAVNGLLLTTWSQLLKNTLSGGFYLLSSFFEDKILMTQCPELWLGLSLRNGFTVQLSQSSRRPPALVLVWSHHHLVLKKLPSKTSRHFFARLAPWIGFWGHQTSCSIVARQEMDGAAVAREGLSLLATSNI